MSQSNDVRSSTGEGSTGYIALTDQVAVLQLCYGILAIQLPPSG